MHARVLGLAALVVAAGCTTDPLNRGQISQIQAIALTDQIVRIGLTGVATHAPGSGGAAIVLAPRGQVTFTVSYDQGCLEAGSVRVTGTVSGTLNGERPASFVVDTGGEVISISQATAGGLEWDPDQRRIPLKVYGSSGWDPDAFLLPGVNLQFQQIRFSNIPVVVLNLRTPSVLLGFQLGGIVGHKFLSKYRVAIDLERSVVRLKSL